VIWRGVVYLLFGLAFGFLFAAAGLNQYDVIHRMLLLENLDPFLIMGSAVATATPILWLLERRAWHSRLGGRLELRRSPIERRHLYGGIVFGAGWAITGACPGTLSTTLGAGSLLGLPMVVGVLIGIAARDTVVERRAGLAAGAARAPLGESGVGADS
jgi:hypothetical protein